MNWDQIEGNWKQLKGNIQNQWAILSDDDLDKINGKCEELAGKIQKNYGISKEKAQKQIDGCMIRYAKSDHNDLEEELDTIANNKRSNKFGYFVSFNNDSVMDYSGKPNPNPMPDDLDEPTHAYYNKARNNETPQQEKSLNES